MKLFDAIDRFLEAREWIEEHGDEIERAGGMVPDELIEKFDAAFEADEALEAKVEKTIAAERELRTLAERAKGEADRLAALAKSYEREADSVKVYLGIALRRGGLKRLDTAVGKAAHYWNSRPSIEPFADEIPEAFRRTRVEFDGAKAYEVLKAAGAFPDREEENGGVPVQSARILEKGTKITDPETGEETTLEAPVIVRLGTHFRVW